jgi:hypothetical protein
MTREKLFEEALAACGGDELVLARSLGYAGNIHSASRAFSRWRKGEGLDYKHTIKLLRVAGLLVDGPVRREEHEEVATLVERQWDDVRLALESLEQIGVTLATMSATLATVDSRLSTLEDRSELRAAGERPGS